MKILKQREEMGMGGKRRKDEGEATEDVEEERAGNPSNKKRQILPSSIKNKEKRSAIHAKIKHENKLEKKKKSKAREIAVKKALELGEELPPNQVPRTIENTREFDETVCKPDDEEICQMCDQELHVASDCRWVYSSCKVDNCDGIRLLLTSKTSINNGRKFLRCQFSGCSGFQWLDEAIAELNEPILTLNEHRGCCGCGSTSHGLKECPWKSSSCPKKGCNGIRDIRTSTQGLTLGRKFFKCEKCGKFDWFSRHNDELINAVSVSKGSPWKSSSCTSNCSHLRSSPSLTKPSSSSSIGMINSSTSIKMMDLELFLLP